MKDFGTGIENIISVACSNPEISIRTLNNAGNKIVGYSSGIGCVMLVYLKGITIVTVQAGHGTYPNKSAGVLINTIYVILGKPVVDIQPREPDIYRLS
jgi:hypothetical protein